MRGAEIGLLHQLQRLLHGGEAAFVVGELNRREVLDRGEARSVEHNEVGGFHVSHYAETISISLNLSSR